MSDNVKVVLSSDMGYEKLTAEIFIDEKFVALINQDKGFDNLRLEFPDSYADESSVLRTVSLDLFNTAIEMAVSKLKE